MLEVNCSEYSQQELEEYLRFIDEFFSNSLTEIIFTECNKDPTSQWKNIFAKVEAVRFKSKGVSAIAGDNIHHFFPNMRILQSNVHAYADTSFLAYNFPHLEKLFYASNTDDNQTMDFF